MKILIIGGSKFIGKAIANSCKKAGHDIVLFNRGKSQEKSSYKLIKGNIENLTDFKKELLSHNFDAVIHCICFTKKEAKDLVSIFRNTKTRLLILSSMDCYEAFQDLVKNIKNSDMPIDESSPVTKFKHYYKDSGIRIPDYDKNLVTQVFMKEHKKKLVSATVFRLPMVYGPDDYQFAFRHGQIIRRILDGQKRYIIANSTYNRIWTFGYIENIAEAITFSLNKSITEGKIYNLGENKFRPWKSWCDLFAASQNFSFEYMVIPDELIERNNELKNQLPFHLIFDCNLFNRETGFSEPVSIEKAIKKTFDFAKKNQSLLGNSPDYKKEEILLKKYQDFIKKIKMD